jgi:hypothetical protein
LVVPDGVSHVLARYFPAPADAGQTFALTAGQHLVRFHMETTGNVKVTEYVGSRFSTLRYRDRIGARKLWARLVKHGYTRF